MIKKLQILNLKRGLVIKSSQTNRTESVDFSICTFNDVSDDVFDDVQSVSFDRLFSFDVGGRFLPGFTATFFLLFQKSWNTFNLKLNISEEKRPILFFRGGRPNGETGLVRL
jgi:hypothetical protein